MYRGFGFNVLLILLPPIPQSLFEKHDGKNNLIAALELRYNKIIFASLYKIIALNMQPTFANI